MIRRLLFVAVLCVGLATPAHAGVNGQSGGFAFRGPVKGLVTVTQANAEVELAFNLFGLAPQTEYRLLAKKGRCDTSAGHLFGRSFTTDGQGSSWDPVPIKAEATAIKSVAIRERSSGQIVACANRTIPVGPDNDSSKVDRPRAVVMVSEANALWQLIESFSDLKPNTAYRAVALPGGCVRGSQPVFGKSFRSNSTGNALVRVKRQTVDGQTIGAVGLVQRSTGAVVFCKAV